MTDQQRNNGNKLYRNQDDGMIAGVCAGLADFFGFDRSLTRVATAIAAFLFPPTIIGAYLLLWIVLQPNPAPKRRETAEEYRLQQRIRSEPHSTLESVRHRFRELERRLQRLETHVTSNKFRLEREIDGLRD